MTPLGNEKNVIQTDCHINQSFLVPEGPFGSKKVFLGPKKLSYKAIVILSGEYFVHSFPMPVGHTKAAVQPGRKKMDRGTCTKTF